MAANQSPLYTLTPCNTWAKITSADTGTDGTGANVAVLCTVDQFAGFGAAIKFQAISTSGSTTTSVACARIYLNNGGSAGTAANNILIGELTLPATAVNTSATAQTEPRWFTYNYQVPASFRFLVGISAMAASTQWNVIPYVGSY